MLDEWRTLAERNDEAVWWIRKAGNEHYGEHLDRLAEWTEELIARRSERASQGPSGSSVRRSSPRAASASAEGIM